MCSECFINQGGCFTQSPLSNITEYQQSAFDSKAMGYATSYA